MVYKNEETHFSLFLNLFEENQNHWGAAAQKHGWFWSFSLDMEQVSSTPKLISGYCRICLWMQQQIKGDCAKSQVLFKLIDFLKEIVRLGELGLLINSDSSICSFYTLLIFGFCKCETYELNPQNCPLPLSWLISYSV